MSDSGGLGGALMLGQQLEIYRWEDHRQRAREGNALAATDAAWRSQYDSLVNQYNQLLRDANRLADVHDRERALKDRQIAELTAANATQLTEVQRLTTELAAAKESAKFLRGTIRELRGETYRSVFEDE